MGQSLGNASLVLSTSAGKLYSGLQEAGSKSVNWAKDTSTSVSGKLGGIGGKLAGFLSAGPHIAAIAAIGTTIFEAISQPFDKLKELGGLQKRADVLGVSASELQGMGKLLEKVGIDGDQASHVFAIMGKNVGKLADHGSKGAEALARMGISVSDLQGQDLTGQFKTIADGISRLPKGAEQASAAMALFGKSGDQLLPMLQRGGGGIDAFIAKQKAVGAILSDGQIKAAADAAKAWKESKDQIAATWDGLVNRATLIAAPVVKLIGGLVSKAFALLTPVFEWLGRAIERVSIILEAVGEVLSGWIDEAINWFKELAGEVFSFGDSWPTIQEVVTSVLKGIGMGLALLWDTLKSGAGAMAFAAGYIVKGFGAIVDALKSTIKDALDIAAQLPDELGGDKFRKWSASVGGWGSSIDKAGDKMKDWGKDAMMSWGKSAEDVGKWFDKLEFKRKEDVKQAKGDAADLAKAAEYRGINTMLKGSKEAYSVEAKFRWDSANKAKEDKALDEQKKGNGLLANIVNLLKDAPLMLKAG